MGIYVRKRLLIVIACILSIIASSGLSAIAQDKSMGCVLPDGDSITIAEAKLYIEYNSTDEDLGVHGSFGDDGWSELCIYDPNGALILMVAPQSQFGNLGLGTIFFESREPRIDEFSYNDLVMTFPEGEYSVVGTNYDGTGLTGTAVFSHNVPTAPTVIAPIIAEEDMADETRVAINDLVIEWEDVTETTTGEPVTITGYEVIITNEEYDDPNGFSRPIFDVHVPSDRNSLSVPVEFLEADTLYELEVLALESSGNQTITVGFFTTDLSR